MRNPLGMLHCEAILKSGGGSRVATIAETQEFVRFRTQKPHADNDERDGLRFYDTLTDLIPENQSENIFRTSGHFQNSSTSPEICPKTKPTHSFLATRKDLYRLNLLRLLRKEECFAFVKNKRFWALQFLKFFFVLLNCAKNKIFQTRRKIDENEMT